MRLIEALDYATEKLNNCCESPEFEATVLLEEVSGKSKEEILIKNEILLKGVFKNFEKLITRRTNGEPLQYIIGKINFLGIDVIVNQKSFIPRVETEFMTDYAIMEAKLFKNPRILEIGTGSGAIAVSLALNLPDSLIFATDISIETLGICKKNIAYHQLKNQIFTLCADSIKPIRLINQFDIIISNPPYIPEEEFPYLPELVKREPRIAIDGGRNGVFIINQILRLSPLLLKKNGILYIELAEVNIPYLDIPEDLNFKVLDDHLGKKRIFRGVKK